MVAAGIALVAAAGVRATAPLGRAFARWSAALTVAVLLLCAAVVAWRLARDDRRPPVLRLG